MAIGIRASGSVTYDASIAVSGGAFTRSVTKPSGTTAGDLAVVIISWAESGTSPNFTSAAPSGWSAIAENVGGANGVTGTQRTSAYYRLIQAGDTSWNFVITRVGGTQSTDDIGVVFQSFTGVDQTTPIDATGTASTNSGSSTLVANAVTIATANAWECIGVGTYTNAACSATGFTDLPNGSPANTEQSDLLYNTTPKSIGSTGTVTVTGGASTGNTMTCIPFAIRPAIPIVPFPEPFNQWFVQPPAFHPCQIEE